ncbi:unnamed protein product, partial [marine sediment metagenome]
YFVGSAVLEIRLSAARAAALDELLAANLPTDVAANLTAIGLRPLASEYTAPRAAALTNLGRSLEGYTLTVGVVSDNADQPVTVLDITGRGILVDIGAIGEEYLSIYVTLVIDGDTVINNEKFMNLLAVNQCSWHSTLFAAFDTTCLLTMKGVLNTVADFHGCALVE